MFSQSLPLTTAERPVGLIPCGIETILNPYAVLLKGMGKA